MQFTLLLIVFAAASIPVLTDDPSERKEVEVSVEGNAGGGRSLLTDGNYCLCKVGHIQLQYKEKQPLNRAGKKCLCQQPSQISRRKWKNAFLPRQRKQKRYCLKPGKTISEGKRYFYCVETWHRMKKCTPCKPMDFIPTPL